MDDHIQKVQVERLRHFRLTRNQDQTNLALSNVGSRAVAGENIMPAVLEAVEKNCTLGEIADTLRGIYGEYR